MLQGAFRQHLWGKGDISLEHVPRRDTGQEPGWLRVLGLAVSIRPPGAMAHKCQQLALLWGFLPLPPVASVSAAHVWSVPSPCSLSPDACSLGEMALPLRTGLPEDRNGSMCEFSDRK